MVISPKPATQTASFRNGLYVVAVLLLPLLVLWHRDNFLYSPPWCTDPWFYLGYFKDLVDFKRDLFPSFHSGSRYPWILPGYLIHSLFSPVTANCILHLTVHSIAVLSLFSILRRWRLPVIRNEEQRDRVLLRVRGQRRAIRNESNQQISYHRQHLLIGGICPALWR